LLLLRARFAPPTSSIKVSQVAVWNCNFGSSISERRGLINADSRGGLIRSGLGNESAQFVEYL